MAGTQLALRRLSLDLMRIGYLTIAVLSGRSGAAMNPAASLLTVSGILIGFLFTGFWWSLDRELSFRDKGARHFQIAYGLLLLTIMLLGYFGVILPLRLLVRSDSALLWTYRGIVLALLSILGYMLTVFAHYSIFQWQKYGTKAEKICFAATLAVIAGLCIWWILR
jgi:hypothetical protein